MKSIIVLILIVFVQGLSAQEPKLQFGLITEFKDEFFLNPNASVKYLEFHSLSINGILRVSGNRFGLESSLGFEKSIDAFIRFSDNSSAFNYHKLDRLSLSAMPFVYLMKKKKDKIDLGLALKYYVNLNNELTSPMQTNVDLFKFSTKCAINYSIKKFQFGIFGEYDLVLDYSNLPKPFSFGFRMGYLGL